MPSPQEQFADSLRSGQEAVAKAVDAPKSAQSAFGTQSPAAAGSFDPNQVIDQVFDFAEQMLRAQREYAKTLNASAASAAEAVRAHTDTGGETKGADAGRSAPAPRRQSRARKG